MNPTLSFWSTFHRNVEVLSAKHARRHVYRHRGRTLAVLSGLDCAEADELFFSAHPDLSGDNHLNITRTP